MRMGTVYPFRRALPNLRTMLSPGTNPVTLPVFEPETLNELMEFGEVFDVEAGDIVCEAGTIGYPFFVVIDAEPGAGHHVDRATGRP